MVPRPGCSSHRLHHRRVGCDRDMDTDACFEKRYWCRRMFKRKQQGLPNKVGTGIVLNAIGSPKSSGRGGGMFSTPTGSEQSFIHNLHVCWCCSLAAFGLLQKPLSNNAPTLGIVFVLPSLHYVLFHKCSVSTLLRG